MKGEDLILDWAAMLSGVICYPLVASPPRMVMCELSRVCCWLRRRQQQIST